MSKLIKLPGFNQPPRMRITLPYAPEQILFQITVMVLQDGKIDLTGHINDLELGKQILAQGVVRLLEWHKQKIQVAAPKPFTSEMPDHAYGEDDASQPEGGPSCH